MLSGALPRIQHRRMEQNLQVGSQLDDKVLSNAVPDERAREPGIDELRSIYPAPEQHHRKRPVILPRRPEKALDVEDERRTLARPIHALRGNAPWSCR